MEPLSPHRTFVDPGNVRGLPGVTKRTPIPEREIPLEGTKTMLCPKDEHLRDLVTGRSIEVILPSRTARILGILAMVCAVWAIAVYWICQIPDLPEAFVGLIAFGYSFLGLGLFHLLVIFSQILSSGRNRLSVWAIVVLYAGMVLNVLLEWWFA